MSQNRNQKRSQVTQPKNRNRPTKSNRQPKHRVASWEPLPDDRETMTTELGENAVAHTGETRGRRSTTFPNLNITATAKRLGVTKSHLAKVLGGKSRPSIELALRIARALNCDVNVVIDLYRRSN